MLRVEMLGAAYGDCIGIEYGRTGAFHRILIDGGIASTCQGALEPWLARGGDPCTLDLLVVTHIDLDHIGGILALLEERPGAIAPADVWFNGRDQISDLLGAKEGDELSVLLAKLRLPWNAAFDRKAVVVPPDGELPRKELPGGARLTLVAPGIPELKLLEQTWDAEVAKARRRAPGPTANDLLGARAAADDLLGKHEPPGVIAPEEVPALAEPNPDDDSPANGSSIAFVLEYEGHRVLLSGDSHPRVLAAGLARYGEGQQVSLSAVKLPHHASRRNVSSALLDAISCREFLVSTNGNRFGHPDPEAIARIAMLPGAKTLRFNYRTDYTRPWASARLDREFGIDAKFEEDAVLVLDGGRGARSARSARAKARAVASPPAEPKKAAERTSLAPRRAGDDRLGGGGGDDVLGAGRAAPQRSAASGDMLGGPRAGIELESLGAPVAGAPAPVEGWVLTRSSAACAVVEAAPGTRFVQAELLTDPGVARTKTEALLPRVDHELDVWIGPKVEGAAVAEEPIDLTAVPAGAELTVVFTDPVHAPNGETRTIALPERGATARCVFRIAASDAPVLDGQVTVLHGNRVLQALRVVASVGRGLSLHAPIHVDMGALMKLPPLDAALVVTADRPGKLNLLAAKDGKVAYVRGSAVDEMLAAIRRNLEAIAEDPGAYGAPDTPGTADALLRFARMGELLRTGLFEQAHVAAVIGNGPLKRIQVISSSNEPALPLEFCYDGKPPPLRNGRVCAHWRDALEDGKCEVACPDPAERQVCPLQFWGLGAVLERHAWDPEEGNLVGSMGAEFAIVSPEPGVRDRLEPLERILFAKADAAASADERAFAQEIDAVKRAVEGAGGTMKVATSWAEWQQLLAENPTLLLLITHTEPEGGTNTLHIGSTGSEPLGVGDIQDGYVRAKGANGGPGPVVLLLGCKTAKTDIPFANLASRFRLGGASIVVGTIASIRGRHAAPAARAIVEELRTHAGHGESFGDVLTAVRRDLLRQGNLVGLCLTAFGDAEWRL
ncbi:MAG TPA: MBL fold metallo-hydrolase [Anaeromyxobacteraceae bacterium]|nr:MBL fold metallo-hydrolase [Anaeromyxobacteraceae bacterium]